MKRYVNFYPKKQGRFISNIFIHTDVEDDRGIFHFLYDGESYEALCNEVFESKEEALLAARKSFEGRILELDAYRCVVIEKYEKSLSNINQG